MADRPRTPPSLVAWLLLVGAFVGTAFGMAQTFGQPFQREWLGRNGARYAHIARNYERDGLLAARGAPRLDVVGHADPAAPEVYAHHPPGLSMAIAVASRAYGVDEEFGREDAARLVPSVATLLGLALLARLVQVVVGRTRGAAVGLWSAAVGVTIVAAMPMTHVYGAHPDPQGAPVLAGSLLVLLAYERWQRVPGALGAALVVAATALASSFDWYALYTPVLCAVHLWWTRPERRGAAVGLTVASIGVFVAWLAWIAALPGMDVGRLVDAAGVRAASGLDGEDATVARYVAAWFGDTRTLMPGFWLFVFMALYTAVRGSGDMAPGGALGLRGLVALLVTPPLLHAAAFPSGLIVHDYWLFGLPPALGVAVGAELVRRQRWPGALAVVLAFALVGGLRTSDVLDQSVDPVPALLGTALAERTAPGDVVLTSYTTNPFSSRPEGYTMMQPGITFYADRLVRGGLVDLSATAPDGLGFDAALAWAAERRPPDGHVWFLLDAWTARPSAALRAAVDARTDGDPIHLDPSVDVWLHRLRVDAR